MVKNKFYFSISIKDTPMGKEMPSDYYDQIYSDSDDYKTSYLHSEYLPAWTYIRQEIDNIAKKKLCGPSIPITDIGCGSGQLFDYLSDMGYTNYTGVDFSEAAISMAKSIANRKAQTQAAFFVEDAFKFFDRHPIVINGTEIFLFLEILEHINSDLSLLKRIPPDKVVVISVPRFDDKAHVRHFNSIKDVKKKYGKIVKFEKLDQIISWIIGIGKILP
jgi:2-polyprenyl-3-methyl-5-hydroxy-6-metoxy-1,4-benzoquinol methylase